MIQTQDAPGRRGTTPFVIGTVQSPGLREMRTLVGIPAADYGESAMHLACLRGRRCSVRSFNPALPDLPDEQIDGYRCALAPLRRP